MAPDGMGGPGDNGNDDDDDSDSSKRPKLVIKVGGWVGG